MFLVYALVQRTEAIRNAEEAKAQSRHALEAQARAIASEKLAHDNLKRIELLLDSCRSSK